MSATNQFELDLLDLLLTNVTAPNIGDVTGIAGGTVGALDLSLHTSALSDTDTLATANETAYTNYVRKSVPRNTTNWLVASGQVDNKLELAYPACGVTGATVTYFGFSLWDGGDYLQLWGALTSSLVISDGITPSFAATAVAITLD